MFVDTLTIYAEAGRGGDGVERWLREPHRPKGGPAGGDGGRGGDVYLRAVRDVYHLARYTDEPSFRAGRGGAGGGRSRAGGAGEDLTIDVPVGSVATNLATGDTYELTEVGQTVRILRGGVGGYGNEHFKSSTNRSPTETTPGKRGEAAEFRIEVALAADIGIIGLPNAGKSTLLNALTNARARVGSYPFTTLEPNLGDLGGLIIADIPGLIEGASAGKGLGYTFLRHIGKARMLLHAVPLTAENPEEEYQTVRAELARYDETLTTKEEWVVLTKADEVDEARAQEVQQQFASRGERVFVTSALDDHSVTALADALLEKHGVRRSSPGAGQGEEGEEG